MTEPSLAPVEDRLRRTFDARAEDMAPGDAEEGDPIPPLVLTRSGDPEPGRRFRRPARPVLVAAAVLVVALAAAAVAVVVAGDDGSDHLATADPADPDLDTDRAIVELVIAPRDLIDALEAERDLAMVELIGAEDLIELPETDRIRVRGRTDEDVAILGALTSDAPAASAYRPALDQLAGLGDLRTEIDRFPGTRDLQNSDYAEQIAGEYEDLVTGLLDAQRELVQGIDDPELRKGGLVYQMGLQQRELTVQLVRAALLTVVNYAAPGGLTELSRRQDAVEHGQDELLAEAAGSPYEDAAATVVGEVDDSGLLGLTTEALDGPVEITELLAAVEVPADEGWPAFLDQVERLLVNERR